MWMALGEADRNEYWKAQTLFKRDDKLLAFLACTCSFLIEQDNKIPLFSSCSIRCQTFVVEGYSVCRGRQCYIQWMWSSLANWPTVCKEERAIKAFKHHEEYFERYNLVHKELEPWRHFTSFSTRVHPQEGGWCRVAAPSPPPKKRNLKSADFVDTILNGLHDLPFSQHQPLKSKWRLVH